MEDRDLPPVRLPPLHLDVKVDDVLTARAQAVECAFFDEILVFRSSTTHQQRFIGKKTLALLVLKNPRPLPKRTAETSASITVNRRRRSYQHHELDTEDARVEHDRQVWGLGIGPLPDLLIILTTHVLNGRLIRDLNAATEQRAPLVIFTGFDTLEAVVNASSQGTMGTTGAVLIKTAR